MARPRKPRGTGFVPFAKFLDQTAKAPAKKHVSAMVKSSLGTKRTARAAAQDAAGAEFEKMRHYVLSLYKDMNVKRSYMGVDGQHVDCVPIDQQPSLAGREITLATPPDFLEPPASETLAAAAGHPVEAVSALTTPGEKDAYGNEMACPPGFVPMRRVTLARLANAGTMEAFFQKAPGGGGHPSLGHGRMVEMPSDDSHSAIPPPAQAMGGYIHRYAHAAQQVVNNGGRSWLNIWQPASAPGVFSLSQQWYAGGSGSGLQTVEGGWHVFPQLYNGASDARLFIYFTADGYQNTGSYNLTTRPGHQGFIQTNNSWVLGGSIAPVSSHGGAQKGFLMQWQRDNQGNWWLYLGALNTGTPIGYFPVSIYGSGQLSQFAQSVDYGGEVCSNQGSSSTGPMGSGAQAASGFGAAAFHKEIYAITQGGQMTPAQLYPDQRDGPYYTIDLQNQSSGAWKTYFFFGGPFSP